MICKDNKDDKQLISKIKVISLTLPLFYKQHFDLNEMIEMVKGENRKEKILRENMRGTQRGKQQRSRETNRAFTLEWSKHNKVNPANQKHRYNYPDCNSYTRTHQTLFRVSKCHSQTSKSRTALLSWLDSPWCSASASQSSHWPASHTPASGCTRTEKGQTRIKWCILHPLKWIIISTGLRYCRGQT